MTHHSFLPWQGGDALITNFNFQIDADLLLVWANQSQEMGPL